MESRLKSKRASPRAKPNRRLRLKLMPTISTHQSSMKKCSWMMMRETHLCRKPVGLGSDRMSMRQQYHKSIITTLLMPLNKSKNLKMISLISFIQAVRPSWPIEPLKKPVFKRALKLVIMTMRLHQSKRNQRLFQLTGRSKSMMTTGMMNNQLNNQNKPRRLRQFRLRPRNYKRRSKASSLRNIKDQILCNNTLRLNLMKILESLTKNQALMTSQSQNLSISRSIEHHCNRRLWTNNIKNKLKNTKLTRK